MKNNGGCRWKNLMRMFVLAVAAWQPGYLLAQTEKLPPEELKKLSVEQLMNIEVTSVSKNPEKLTEVASAIQVVTGEDIRRSTATRLPEALRLASNLQVAQSNSHDWGITARGFNGAPLSNNTLADKLLVMIDGRSIYTPLFGGVFWDVQNVLLEDVDRIEVVSGPGGTLWGANAVNGVINVITKSARETQGLYVSGAAGSFLQDYGGLRYGTHIGSNLFIRIFGQRFDQKNSRLQDGRDARDAWHMTQSGFRMDYFASTANTLTVQGDFYGGEGTDPSSSSTDGQNILGRWSHSFNERSTLSVQAYFDRTWRHLQGSGFKDELTTYDLDMQHLFPIGLVHHILWGVGYRIMEDQAHNTASISFIPEQRTLQLFNGFVQDQIAVIPSHLTLTVGTKLLHNDYSGLELQPSVRLAWTPNTEHTVWTAISRAVRTPSRFDTDEMTPTLSTRNRQFDSEKVIAYELGYRIRPVETISFSLAAFFNQYDDLRSINISDAPPTDYVFANDQRADSWGLELSGNVIATSWWRLRGGYTYLNKKFTSKTPAVLPGSDWFEGVDPQNQVLLQSIMNLPKHFQLDFVGRYVDLLPSALGAPAVPSFITFDVRLAWAYKFITLMVAGQNLSDSWHPEFGSREIPRSIYVKSTFRF